MLSSYFNTYLTDKPACRGRNGNHVRKLFPADDHIGHPGDSGTDVALGIIFLFVEYLLTTLNAF